MVFKWWLVTYYHRLEFRFTENSVSLTVPNLTQRKNLFYFDLHTGKSLPLSVSVYEQNFRYAFYHEQYKQIKDNFRKLISEINNMKEKNIIMNLHASDRRQINCAIKRFKYLIEALSLFKSPTAINKANLQLIRNVLSTPYQYIDKNVTESVSPHPTSSVVIDNDADESRVDIQYVENTYKDCIKCGEPTYGNSMYCWFHYSEEHWKIK